MSNEARTAVEQILSAAGVAFAATHKGKRKRDNWECDAWLCTFTPATRPQEPEEFDYFTGLGHRKLPPPNELRIATIGHGPLTPKDLRGETEYGRRILEGYKVPVAPHAADVLYSLLMDASASQQSFADWCSEYVYDTDSRKAFATYEACQQNADKLARILPHAAREQLREALQDY